MVFIPMQVTYTYTCTGSSPPEAALLFLLRKRELSSGVVALLCLVSMTDRSCTYYGSPETSVLTVYSYCEG